MTLTKTVTNTKKLLSMLKIADKLTKKAAVPIIENICINKGTAWATNLYHWMEIKDIFPDNEDILVNIKDFIAIISSIKQEEIELEIENGKLYIVTNTTKMCIANEYNTSDFPVQLPKMPITPARTMLYECDIEKIVTASQFASNDKVRENLTYVLFGEEIVATDAQRLFFDKNNAINAGILKQYDFNNTSQDYILIDKLTIDILKTQKVVQITCDITEISVDYDRSNHILYEFDEFNWYQKIADYKFPDYKAVIPTEFNCFLLVNRDELLDAINQTKYVWSDMSNKQICISYNDKGLKISAYNIDKNTEHETYVNLYGKNSDIAVDIAFNPVLLKSCLEIQDEPILIKYIQPNKCIIINDNVLLMPVLKY